eukprot:CAMPEP_0202859022 /NCGR_PEP_ID=MMETSP1391-20130828/1320_1 /ASSEMBLY_ACC=CAM_ASM_000867 /TAXON_ID=1034604 /ORGANISM="Chlamydomonas leiostraca, Strain SAG 11-49" /LENGTH=393 /DNA_ID=CAMNT_0049538019 /DNA_START=96 /DNA_END=1274 /DNA_ORIENTATION=+
MAGLNAAISPAITRLAAEQAAELQHAEAAHVYAVLKHTLEKLGLVGVITVDPKVQAQELTQSVGEEITRMIAQQKRLEQRFEELVSAQHALRDLPNKSKLRENQAELQQVAEALRQSTKQLCRNLKDNPNVAENMAKVASERQALALLLSNTLSELEVFHKVTPVLEAVLASEAAKVAMEHTIEHERTTTSAVKQLRNDLKDERTDHDDKIREKKKLVEGLKRQLKEMKMSTAVETRYIGKDLTAGNEASRRLENTSLADMRRELTLVRQQIDIEASVHAATVDFLRRLATKLQEESINWGSRHDDDLGGKDRDLEQLKQAHARDERRLRDIEEKYRTEVALRTERENKEAEEREREEMAALTHAKREESALKIQALFRGYMVRKDMSGGKKG